MKQKMAKSLELTGEGRADSDKLGGRHRPNAVDQFRRCVIKMMKGVDYEMDYICSNNHSYYFFCS